MCQLLLPCYIWILTDVVCLMMDARTFPVSCVWHKYITWSVVIDYISTVMLLGFTFFLYIFLLEEPCVEFIAYILVSAGFRNLKVLNLGFNDITDACLVHLKGGCLSLSYLHKFKILIYNFCFVFRLQQWKMVQG